MNSWLVISQEEESVRTIRDCFRGEKVVENVADITTGLDELRKNRYDCILIDINLLAQVKEDNGGYKSALQPFWRLYPTLEVIVMTPPGLIREAVMAVKAGAGNYLTYPISREELTYITESTYRLHILESELDYLRAQFWQRDALDFIYTDSPLMQDIFDKIRSVAPTKSTVLLTGETGTGKGVLAKLIHGHSNRKEGPFIAVHCGAIPETLVESELFGHEKGAFTGAVRRKLGKFEIAREGTIFLDEIGTVPPSVQVKLLQVLQDRTFSRVGGEQTLEADVRIIAATNMNLKEMCHEGLYRKDLFYRLNVFPLEIPPLRERREDIFFIAEVILKRLNKLHGRDIRDIDSAVVEALREYPWPGNIRELENILERAYILEQSSILTAENFPPEIALSVHCQPVTAPTDASISLAEARNRGVAEIEQRYLRSVLTRNKGSIKKSAEEARITTRQMHKLMTRYGLRKDDFR